MNDVMVIVNVEISRKGADYYSYILLYYSLTTHQPWYIMLYYTIASNSNKIYIKNQIVEIYRMMWYLIFNNAHSVKCIEKLRNFDFLKLQEIFFKRKI